MIIKSSLIVQNAYTKRGEKGVRQPKAHLIGKDTFGIYVDLSDNLFRESIDQFSKGRYPDL